MNISYEKLKYVGRVFILDICLKINKSIIHYICLWKLNELFEKSLTIAAKYTQQSIKQYVKKRNVVRILFASMQNGQRKFDQRWTR